MLIKLNDNWHVDAALVSSVRFSPHENTICVSFHEGGSAIFKAPESEVERIVRDVNMASEILDALFSLEIPRPKDEIRR